MSKFKVGDRVRRNFADSDQTVRVVTEVFQGGWFNYLGATAEYYWAGGCYDLYWGLVEAAPTARANDPATSKGKRKVNKYEACVLELLGRNPVTGLTGKQMAQLSGFPLNSITPRCAPLRRKDKIKDSGVRRDKQIVWVLC